MPSSVAIGVLYFAYLAIAAGIDAMPARRRYLVASIATGLIVAGVLLSELPATAWRTHVLNWLPGAYLLAGYWLPAQLPLRFSPSLARWLQATDGWLFERGLRRLTARAPRVVLEYLEASYLCCYVVVPLGLVWLYAAGESGEANRFWSAVLLAALPCYGLLPWLETRPPRVAEGLSSIDRRGLFVRSANLRVLRGASVGSNTFPSGHAAASVAAALVVGAVTPLPGVVFGIVAVSIAVASVIGRYHYALDAVIGVAAGAAGFALSR